MIYLDNAATTGIKPQKVVNAVKYALEHYSSNPGRSGHIASVQAADMVYKTREKIADFFGADGPENVVFTMNCTHSANCILKGVLRRGDHVVVSSLEHNAIMRPLIKTGVSYSVAEVSLQDDGQTVKNFAEQLKPYTKLVFCTAASNVLGKMLPIEKIGELCRKKGVLFAVDAAQTAGVIPINMKKQSIDYLCIAPHKGLYAPMGTGILIARKNIPNTLIEGGTGTNSLELFQPENLPERLESGTINVPGIAGISAGVDFIKKVGLQKIYTHELNLISRLYSGLEKIPQIQMYTPKPSFESYMPVLSFNFKEIPSVELASIMSENNFAVRGGLHCAPTAHRQIGTLPHGTVRISVGIFNTEKEIDALLQFLHQKSLKK